MANNALIVPKKDDENESLATARAMLSSNFRHAVTVSKMLKPTFGDTGFEPGFGDYASAIAEKASLAAKGDLGFISEMLAAQVLALDTVFSEMSRRMALNIGDYPVAAETFGRMAMKAQAQCRATSETLAKLHQPREQTVRHVHVNDGGKAVIAEQFHQHTGGQENAESNIQPHAQRSGCKALLGTDTNWHGVPISSSQEPSTMPDARR
jgi:hypothetical protein